MKKKKEGKKLCLKDQRPLPVGYIITGFLIAVAGFLFYASGRLELTWAVLAILFGFILIIASFKSLKNSC